MKIFLDTTYRRNKEHEANYRKIYEYIEQLGHTHLFTNIVNNIPLDEDNTATSKAREKSVELYQKRLEYLHKSDVNIFEASIPSLSTGLLIEKSLDMNKPTIVLYLENNIPTLIAGIENDKLLLAPYTKTNLKRIVEEILVKVNQIKDKRFNFFISPQLLEYLERASKDMGITKSTFIRRLILKHMKTK